MANTYIVSSSQFKPYTFDDMIKPHAMFTEAMDRADENRSSLSVLGEAMESKITDLPEDADLKNAYETYMKEVGSMADAINNNDLKTAKSLGYKLKDLFTKTLAPVEEAYKRKLDYETKLRDLAIANPNLIIESPELSTSAFLGGSTPKNPTIINLNDIENEAMKSAASASSRTFSRSGWYNTADGRLIERMTKIGLNDTDFNNALVEVQNFIVSDGKTSLSKNGNLLYESLKDIINNPNVLSLRQSDRLKVLNAAVKGARIGFKYDENVETHSDPLFTTGLKSLKNNSSGIGTDYFMTPNTTKQQIRSTFIDAYSNNAGKLNEDYNMYFKDGKLILPEEIESNVSKMEDEGTGLPFVTPYGYVTPYSVSKTSGKQTYINKYKELRKAFVDLGLDPNNATMEDFVETLNGDVKVRKRLMITSNDPGFERIQTRIESGLKNDDYVSVIEGLEESSLGNMGMYRTNKTVKYEDLLDKNGKLKMLAVNEDPATGQLSAQIKTPEGGYLEILLPDGAGYDADDASDLRKAASSYSVVAQGYYPVIVGYDSDGNAIIEYEPIKDGYIPDLNISAEDYLNDVLEDMKIPFGNLFNFFGSEDVNN